MVMDKLEEKINALETQIEATTGQLNQLLGYRKALVNLKAENPPNNEENNNDSTD